jgi:hypothetical protein
MLAAIGLLIGGGLILAFDTGFKDSDGYYATGFIPVESGSSAIITYPSDFQNDPDWYWEDHPPLTVKVEAVNSDSNKPIFIGIARESDLMIYLNNVSYDKFESFNSHPYSVHLDQIKGTIQPEDPLKQNIWVASASGTGTQTLTWDIKSGSYSLILMNRDSSSPIEARISLGAKIPPFLHAVGIALLIGGFLILVFGGLMMYFSLKGRRKG